MKAKFYFIWLVLIAHGFKSIAQTTIIIQPDSVQGKDAYISDWAPGNYQNLNFGGVNEFDGVAWTANGTGYASRSLIDFSLAAIPATATIISARLSLYHNTNSSQSGSMHQTLSGPNDSRIERITSAWSENAVTWNTQPSTTNQNAVYLPQSTSGTQDYLNIDVTGLVSDIFANQLTSFGMMLRLNNENYYRSVIFCSTDDPNILKHPKLEVTYLDGVTCITLQPDSVNGKDAYISDWPTGNYANTNFGWYPDYDAIAWTDGGVAFLGRGLVQFDFSTIPANATIASAQLSLFNNPTSFQTGGQHYSLSGSNDAVLERITSFWDENLVTWNAQPSTTNLNSVFLAQSISANQDYLNIDVKNLVQDMFANPANSFGFMIKLNTEQIYRSLVFASSDHIDSTKHPKINICYTVPTGGEEADGDNSLIVFPNPFNDEIILSYQCKRNSEIKCVLYDMMGRVLYKEESFIQRKGKHLLKISDQIKNIPVSVYFVHFSIDDKSVLKKIIKR